MSEEEWTIEELADENFLQTSARMTVGKLNAAERAALFRALLDVLGYEKRMAENDSGWVYYVAPKDDIAESVHTTPIYVPLQREEPE